ncbi:hypothetical protein [Pseudomonas kurunegalensis]|uniref:hypothetical protein n=1 Tax=Pseudomonas kurunegalensis TaxID=485880 RepID=UPI0021192883|nr:hypothetical protein [Pseudomonas kurunegalensis]
MKFVTLVVEAPATPIRLGMPLAGGRVTAAGIGDYFSYAELMEAAKDLVVLLEGGFMPGHDTLDAAVRTARELITKLEAQ